MRIYRFWPAAAALALVTSCGLGVPAFPTFGDNTYRIEGFTSTPDGHAVPTVIYRDGPKMRVETTVGNNTHAVIVFDSATNAAYVLTPTGVQPAPAVVSTTTAAATANAPATITTTVAATPPPSVIGVATRIANEDAPKAMEASWASLGADHARSTGACQAANVGGHEWTPSENSAGVERSACITDDGVVLRLKEGNRTLFEATRLDRGPQATALFGVPPGYQVIDPTTVAEQVGATMQHLDSVTGAPPAPAPAPQPPPHG